jgi:hypothetical protein
LTASPTDSLVKNFHVLPIARQKSHEHNTQIESHSDYANNAQQIMQLINERKTCVYQAKQIKNMHNNNHSFDYDYDLYSFNLFKSGGLIEIPKYSTHILVADEIGFNDISVGLYKTNNQNALDLTGDQTVLSPMILVKTNFENQIYSKPIIISLDHSAQSIETQWETSVFYKSSNGARFEEISEKSNLNFYSKAISNKCFMMTERDGIYVLVGRPSLNSANTSKEMKYAIILVNGAVKVFIAQNTRANTEILNEEIQKSNGRIISNRVENLFELNYPTKAKLENSFLNLDLNINYNNSIINSDSTCRKIRMAEVWNSSCDFIEIEIPITINNTLCKQQFNQSINFKMSSNASNSNNTNTNLNKNMFDLMVSLEFENRTLFSYSNLNASMQELHTANCNQQEFYSSVSVNPVYIPLQ